MANPARTPDPRLDPTDPDRRSTDPLAPDPRVSPANSQTVNRVESRTGGTGANICQAVFDDSAARSFSSAQPSEAPFTGSWKPATGTLSSLLADPADGTWTFKVADVVGSDRGSIRNVTLHVAGWV